MLLNGTLNYINFSDVHARVKCHVITGILLSVLMMLHMWTIFLPPIFSKYSIEVKPGEFGWPLSERTPSGFKDQMPYNLTDKIYADEVAKGFFGHTMLQADDVARLAVISFLRIVLKHEGCVAFIPQKNQY